MSIFNLGYTGSEPETVIEEGITENSLNDILTEASEDAFAISAALYVSDISIQEQVLEGATASILMEGVVGGVFERVKNFLIKLKNKIVSWFNAVIRSIKAIFLSGEKFIKEFKNDILNKEGRGFTYKGYPFADALDLDETKVGDVEDLFKETSLKQLGSNDVDITSKKEAIVKAVSGTNETNISEAVKQLKKTLRGADEPEEIENFSKGLKLNEMIEVVGSQGAKQIKELEKGKKEIEKELNNSIKEVEKAARLSINDSKESDDQKALLTRGVTRASELAKFTVSVVTSLFGASIDVFKECRSQSEKVLKSYLRYKPRKEGYGYTSFENDEPSNLFEAAMQIL